MSIEVKCTAKNIRSLGDDWKVAPVLMGEQVYIEAFRDGSERRFFLHVDAEADNRLVYRPSRADATAFVVVPEAQRLRDPIRRQDLFYLRVADTESLYIHVAQPFLRRLLNLYNETRAFVPYTGRNELPYEFEGDVDGDGNNNANNNRERNRRRRRTRRAKRTVEQQGSALIKRLIGLQKAIENDAELSAALQYDSLVDAADALKQLQPWEIRSNAALDQFAIARQRIASILQSLVSQTRAASLGGDSLQLFAIDRAEVGVGSGVPLKVAAKPVHLAQKRGGRVGGAAGGARRHFITYGQEVHFNAPVFRRDSAGRRDADIVCGRSRSNNNTNARHNAHRGSSCRLLEDNSVAIGDADAVDAYDFEVDTFAFVCNANGARRYFRLPGLEQSPLLGTPVDFTGVDEPLLGGTPVDLADDLPPVTPVVDSNEVDEAIEHQVQQQISQQASINAQAQQEQADSASANAIEQTLLTDPVAAQELLSDTEDDASTNNGSSTTGLTWWVWTLIGAAILAFTAALIFAILYFKRKNASNLAKASTVPSSEPQEPLQSE